MEDWTYGVGIALCALLWVHIFIDYRKKLMRVMPGVEQVASRKREFNDKISEAESSRADMVGQIEGLRDGIDGMEEERRELQEKLNQREMVLVPAGDLRMGSNSPGHEEENPEHKVRLKPFYLDRHEVTNMQYKDFVDVAGHRTPVHWQNGTFPNGKADHPVVNVSWEDARVYAEWVGKRLPTEAEWEWAARGTEQREYPWGKQCTPDFANYANAEGKTTSVTKYPKGASEFGLLDMCGNVGEWVSDWFEEKYYARSPESDPQGPPEGSIKVYRGGGYHTNRMDIRAAARHSANPTVYQEYIGFRCAMDVSS